MTSVKKFESGSANAIREAADFVLAKEAAKLINRIERIFVPVNAVTLSPEMSKIPAIMKKFTQKMKMGDFFADVVNSDRQELHPEVHIDKPKRSCKGREANLLTRQVDWDLFEITLAEDVGGSPVYVLPNEVRAEIHTERTLQQEKIDKMLKEERQWRLNERNQQPILGGKWRKTAYPLRCYESLQEYVPTSSISKAEATEMLNELVTPLSGYVGLAYNYDDQDLTEEWMVTYKSIAKSDSSKKSKSNTKDDKSKKSKNDISNQSKKSKNDSKGASEHEVIRTQVEILMEVMLGHVQDRVCTSNDVLVRPPLTIGVHIKEVPVWGIDSYTRRMVELAIEDRAPMKHRTLTSVQQFIEKVLLPAINRQPTRTAHNMAVVLHSIKEDDTVNELNKRYCDHVLASIEENGIDSFRIHPKGTGVICVDPAGIEPHVFISEYLGELYPSYRWCERLDVVEQAQKTFDLKPALADFYNILLERPRSDPRGYGLYYVDASEKANVGSSCSHSCDANCTSAVVARNGKLAIALTTNRRVELGEELCMDYYSITTSEVEWKAAICLCGTTSCRGSFLHYATQDDLQGVLNEKCGPLCRYQSLLRACSPHAFTPRDQVVLDKHGMRASALVVNNKSWMKKYVADILRFIEHERRALPCALLRDTQSLYTFSTADMAARSVMEQRIQSMVCCISLVQQVMQQQPEHLQDSYPLVRYTPSEAIPKVWAKLVVIPELLGKYLMKPNAIASKPQEDDQIEEKEMVDENLISKQKTPLLKSVIGEIEELFREEPKSSAALRQICLSARDKIFNIEHFSSEKARLNQLCDVLALWAYTSNFSYAQDYEAKESAPIVVVARELGTNILRSKVVPQKSSRDSGMRRRNKSSGNEANGSEAVPEQISGEKSPENLKGIVRDGDVCREELKLNDEAMDVDGSLTDQYEVSNLSSEETGGPEISKYTSADCSLGNTAVKDNDTISFLHSTGKADCENQANINSPSKSSWQKEFYLSPDEPVFTSTMKYNSMFVFWQLLGWYTASTDQKSDTNLFGCVQLPEPVQCFGVAESKYGAQERDSLIALLRDDIEQTLPWSGPLKSSFATISPLESEKPLYGSPMLDCALGQVDSVSKVLAVLQESKGRKKANNGNSSSKKRKGGLDGVQQLDNILPPEAPTEWVICDSCNKWRRVPWHVDIASLPDKWICSLNTWDVDNASCDAIQDAYDPVLETTVHVGAYMKKEDASALTIGAWRDVFCTQNKVYYEAQVKKLKPGNGLKTKAKALFHYLGWSPKHDQWIEVDSERIQPYNFHTNPSTHDRREQEEWQGLFGIEPVLRSAIHAAKKPRQATKSEKATASTKPSESTSTIPAGQEQTSRPSRPRRSVISSLSPMTATTEESQSFLAETSF